MNLQYYESWIEGIISAKLPTCLPIADTTTDKVAPEIEDEAPEAEDEAPEAEDEGTAEEE